MRVLVVDDDAVVLDLISEQLAQHGFEALTSRSVEEALEFIGREVPALVLSDILMAPRDGYALLEAVRATHPGVPVLLMSSFSPVGAAEAAERAGAAGFLRKPFTVRQLLDALNAARAKAKGHGEVPGAPEA